MHSDNSPGIFALSFPWVKGISGYSALAPGDKNNGIIPCWIYIHVISRGVPGGDSPQLPPAGTPPALTSLLQCHQHGLLNEIPLDEAAEILGVDGEVGQLEGADGHLQQVLTAAAAAVAGDVGTGQGHDGGAGVGDAAGQALLWGGKKGRTNSKVRQERKIPRAATTKLLQFQQRAARSLWHKKF